LTLLISEPHSGQERGASGALAVDTDRLRRSTALRVPQNEQISDLAGSAAPQAVHFIPRPGIDRGVRLSYGIFRFAARTQGSFMTSRQRRPVKAYQDPKFLASREARALRILAEYLEPKRRFDAHRVEDTIVFMGSARVQPPEQAAAALQRAKGGADLARARAAVAMSAYYEAARQLAFRLTQWSKSLDPKSRRFVVCTGGGPGIMEAANRGAAEARGINVGLNISLPDEQMGNAYITRELAVEFHYFFMRKFWFAYLAKAVIFFPGGFGTLDEMFELLTLTQTRRMKKPMPIVLFGTGYWREVIDFDALARHGMIEAQDANLVHRTDSVDDAYDWITRQLTRRALGQPGPML
jgi:uncharacterized protein (TIGR00730 family)